LHTLFPSVLFWAWHPLYMTYPLYYLCFYKYDYVFSSHKPVQLKIISYSPCPLSINGPYIFRSTFVLNLLKAFSSVNVNVHV
jgi:hypothetical protein